MMHLTKVKSHPIRASVRTLARERDGDRELKERERGFKAVMLGIATRARG